MDLIKDLGRIMAEYKTVWNLEIMPMELRVNIGIEGSDYGEVEEKSKFIPVVYTSVEEFSYIEYERFCKNFKGVDYGVTLPEICAAKRTMDYVEEHKIEINDMLNKYFFYDPNEVSESRGDGK